MNKAVKVLEIYFFPGFDERSNKSIYIKNNLV